MAHLLRIAVIRAWNNPHGLKSLKKILTKIVKEDMHTMRRDIAI